jgi:hypothetical protein
MLEIGLRRTTSYFRKQIKRKMESLKCFECKIEKPLEKFAPNRKKYQIKSSKGRCIVCKKCVLHNAITKLYVVRYNFDDSKFEIIHFKDANEAVEFVNKEEGEY